MDIQVYACGLLVVGDRVVRCALGHGGVREDKREGDGGTPTGRFALREVLYREDRVMRPVTHLPVSTIAPNDGWCDDPSEPAYNKRVILPHTGGHETLYRTDSLYDIVVPLGYNDDPPIAGKGSAIFMHIARDDYSTTEGCVAVAQTDLLTILTLAGPEDILAINPPRL